jgi:hypothetical protein
VPEEVWFFGRSGLFGLLIAIVYWFVSYEIAGTLLLGGFGLATGLAFLVLRAGRPRDSNGKVAGQSREQPFEDEGGLVPLASLAPLEIGLGIGIASLGMAFGIWFLLAGLLPLALGAADWLGAVVRESRAATADGDQVRGE